jgi:hypothetical protein
MVMVCRSHGRTQRLHHSQLVCYFSFLCGPALILTSACAACCHCSCCCPPGYPKFQAVYDNISKDGAKLVLLLRLSPLVPFSLLNYGLGEWIDEPPDV